MIRNSCVNVSISTNWNVFSKSSSDVKSLSLLKSYVLPRSEVSEVKVTPPKRSTSQLNSADQPPSSISLSVGLLTAVSNENGSFGVGICPPNAFTTAAVGPTTAVATPQQFSSSVLRSTIKRPENVSVGSQSAWARILNRSISLKSPPCVPSAGSKYPSRS